MNRSAVTMFSVVLFALLATLTAGLTPAHAAPPANPFAGAWSGTYSAFLPDGTLVGAGSVDWTVSSVGVVLGTHDTGTPNEGVLRGHVKPNGQITIVNPPHGFPTIGEASINALGQMETTMTNPWPGGATIVTVMDAV